MINSKEDYRYYLNKDRDALKRDPSSNIRKLFCVDPIWNFLRLLRKVEYYTNCKNDTISKFYLLVLRLRLKRMQLMLGFTIPPNAVGPGLSLPHYGTIVIHNNARIGANARINVDVVIGENNGADNVPNIGNNVVIEAGAKIFGKIEIADGVHIGANAVVNKSFLTKKCVLAGVPAKIIKVAAECN